MSAQSSSRLNRREDGRLAMPVPGRLFIPAESSEQSCLVTKLSASGAGIRCKNAPPLDTSVVLYVEGFGRFEAVIVQHEEGVVGLRLLCSERKAAQLETMLVV